MTVDRRHLIGLVLRAVVAAAVLVVVAGIAPADAAPLLPLVDPLDEMEILAVRDGEPTEVLFVAPARMMTQTLTGQDVVARVDGTEQSVSLQRLGATDLEVAVVADTTLPQADVRHMQGAIVELALDLPQGATMRLIDAEGNATEPAPVPGPAIAQVRGLRFDTGGDIQQTVDQSADLLDGSPQDRTALLVMGRDLDQRLQPIDDHPLSRTTYVVNVGGAADDDGLLGPQAAGTVITVDDITDVLSATDEMSQDLRNLYRAEVTVPGPEAQTLTLSIPAAGDDAPSRTVALDPDSIRPVEVDPAQGGQDAPQDGGDAAPPAPAGGRTYQGITLRDVLAPAAIVGIALIILALLWLLAREAGSRVCAWRRRTKLSTPTAAAADPPPGAPTGDATGTNLLDTGPGTDTTAADDAPRQDVADPGHLGAAAGAAAATRRTQDAAGSRTRPIAKLSTSTREALAHAHLGLRRLALASREAADSVPDDMFRLTEALASVALSGQRVDLDDVLVARLALDEADGDVGLVLRTATALSTGWQHTARRTSAPPPVIEINAVLTGRAPNGTRKGPQRPVAPVRALNPLVEIGLEHIVLAARPGDDSDLVARAVTAVDVMRAARLARPALAMSPSLLTNPHRYRCCLDADLGDPQQRDEWLEFLCASIACGATDSAERMRRLDRLRRRYRERSADTRVLPLIDLLLSHPVLDANLVRRRLSTSHDAARLLLSIVFESGWLQPHRRLSDTWVADQVLALFTDATDAHDRTSQPA
ncbi:MAG TPA: hypothetical protein VK923_01725 [Euzebyales bacterium]|nr:hypothetical protein [Euzebyales bacterium]